MAAGTMTLREASIELLRAGGPKHYQPLTEEILAKVLASSSSKTPAASINAMIAVDIKRSIQRKDLDALRGSLYRCTTSSGISLSMSGSRNATGRSLGFSSWISRPRSTSRLRRT